MHKITPIPTGMEFYKEMISEKYYYIDKTLLIRNLLVNKNKVTLFTYSRRFGKTSAQNMLHFMDSAENFYHGFLSGLMGGVV